MRKGRRLKRWRPPNRRTRHERVTKTDGVTAPVQANLRYRPTMDGGNVMTKATRGMFCFAVGVIALAGGAMAAGMFDGRYTGPQKTMVNSNRGPCQGLDHDVTVAVPNSTIPWP